jgi:hypothetical protein
MFTYSRTKKNILTKTILVSWLITASFLLPISHTLTTQTAQAQFGGLFAKIVESMNKCSRSYLNDNHTVAKLAVTIAQLLPNMAELQINMRNLRPKFNPKLNSKSIGEYTFTDSNVMGVFIVET